MLNTCEQHHAVVAANWLRHVGCSDAGADVQAAMLSISQMLIRGRVVMVQGRAELPPRHAMQQLKSWAQVCQHDGYTSLRPCYCPCVEQSWLSIVQAVSGRTKSSSLIPTFQPDSVHLCKGQAVGMHVEALVSTLSSCYWMRA